MTGFGFDGNEFERMMRDAEANMASAAEIRSRINEAVGEGEAADGRITAKVNAGDGLTELDLDPRVMRLPSEELSEEIKAAVNAATNDFRNKISEVNPDLFQEPDDAANAVPTPEAALKRIEELGNSFAAPMKDLLRELNVQQQRAQEAVQRLNSRTTRGPDERA